MLKGNLSTRPFYNDRLVSAVLMIVAVVGLGLTAYNALELRALSKTHSELRSQIGANERDAEGIERHTRQLRTTVDAAGAKALAISVHEANELIDRRTFSWTTLLSVIEENIPYNVHLIEVQPKPDKGVMKIEMSVLCRTDEDFQNFVQALQKSRAFSDVTPITTTTNEDGTETARLEGVYLAAPVTTPPPGKAKPGGRAAAPAAAAKGKRP